MVKGITAKEHRERAARCRELARQTDNAADRQALEEMANRYDRFARQQEKGGRTEGEKPKRR